MKKAILIVSFGTTYPATRQKNIEAITRQVQARYPDVLVAEAVSSKVVRAAMKEREELAPKSPEEGLLALKEQGATHVVVFPTHVIDGIENHRMKAVVDAHADAFEAIAVADALLGRPQDYADVAAALWESLKEEVGDAPLVLMGHGSEHIADSSYARFEEALRRYSGHAVYLATVEGAVTISDVIARMQGKKQTRVVVAPFMLVAGDHANHDMAGEADSFASRLRDAGYVPECLIRGIGEYPAVREVYLAHLREQTNRIFAEPDTKKQTGILYGIGVGPGDPNLLTLQALETIKSCDPIILPAVTKEDCYAYQIIRQVYPDIAHKSLIGMPFPMIRDEKKLQLAHARIYETIEELLRQGRRVGMLTIGDPSVYSTYLYMHRRAAEAGWQAQMISGVPSFCAVAARLGIALGEKREEIHIIPAAYAVEDTFGLHGTRIYMKSGKKLEELLEALEAYQKKHGNPFLVYGVSNCGMEQERVYYGIAELKEAGGYLTTVIVKEKD